MAAEQHLPIRWRSWFGWRVCALCRRRWPCGPWHLARDLRSRAAEQEAIAAMLRAMKEATR